LKIRAFVNRVTSMFLIKNSALYALNSAKSATKLAKPLRYIVLLVLKIKTEYLKMENAYVKLVSIALQIAVSVCLAFILVSLVMVHHRIIVSHAIHKRNIDNLKKNLAFVK
jgi:hypothetical protein